MVGLFIHTPAVVKMFSLTPASGFLIWVLRLWRIKVHFRETALYDLYALPAALQRRTQSDSPARRKQTNQDETRQEHEDVERRSSRGPR